jgi:hypothetical protein
MKIKLKGSRAHGRLYLSGMKTQGVDIKKIPPFFEIEIETNNIVAREKSK